MSRPRNWLVFVILGKFFLMNNWLNGFLDRLGSIEPSCPKLDLIAENGKAPPPDYIYADGRVKREKYWPGTGGACYRPQDRSKLKNPLIWVCTWHNQPGTNGFVATPKTKEALKRDLIHEFAHHVDVVTNRRDPDLCMDEPWRQHDSFWTTVYRRLILSAQEVGLIDGVVVGLCEQDCAEFEEIGAGQRPPDD